MLKNTIAALLACLYVGLSVWLVRSEGQSFRESLNRTRPARSGAEASVQDTGKEQPEPPSVTATPPPAPEPEPQPAKRPDSEAPHAAPAHHRATPDVAHAKAKPGGQGTAKKKNVPAEPAQVAMHKPGTPKTDVRHERLDPFWNLPEARKKWDLAKLDDQSEIRLGEQLHAMIVQFNPITRDGALQERVFKAAKPLLTKVTRKQIPYSFTILDSSEINAFSHPGGHVYLSRGLFSFIGEEDAVLQFVLAHEIAHVDQRHIIQYLLDPGVQTVEMSTLQKVYLLILPLGYLDKDEFAADQWAYRQLIALDHTRYEALKFLRKLKGYAAEHELSEGRVNYKLRPGSSPVQSHLWANTAAWRRLDELETYANQVAPKPQ